MPITSPVERISGPRTGSTPGKRRKGNTDSFTAKYGISISRVRPMSRSFRPAITWDARRAKGTPVTLLTKGMVLGGPGIHLKNIDLVILDCILHVYQPHNPEFPGKSIGVLFHLVNDVVA